MSVVWLLGFGALAHDVGENETLVRIDIALDDQIHAGMTAQIAPIYQFISSFGSEIVVGGTVIVCLYFLYKRRWTLLSLWLMAIPGGYALNFVLKSLYNRPRPLYADVFAQPTDTSFPMGHAMLSTIFYGLLAYLLMRAVQNVRWRIIIAFTAVLIAELIGISRIYLGTHYLSEVIAGYLAGGVWLAISITTVSFFHARRSKSEAHDSP